MESETIPTVDVTLPAEPFDAAKAFKALHKTNAAHADRLRDFDERHNEHSELFAVVRDVCNDLHACLLVLMGVPEEEAPFCEYTRNFAWGE